MAATGSPCRTCPYLRMALPLAAQGRRPGREGRHTLSIRTGAVHRRRDVPAVRLDNMSGTDVARYLHAGDEVAHCRRDPGGQRSSLLGRIRTGRMRDVPTGTQPFSYPPEDKNGYSQMV